MLELFKKKEPPASFSEGQARLIGKRILMMSAEQPFRVERPQLAFELDVSKEYLDQLVEGQAPDFPAVIAHRLAKRFRVSADYVLGASDRNISWNNEHDNLLCHNLKLLGEAERYAVWQLVETLLEAKLKEG